MKKFFKTLTGYALVYLGSKLARDADDLHRQGASRRASSNIVMSIGYKLLGGEPEWTIYLRPEDLDDEDEEEEEEEAGPLH